MIQIAWLIGRLAQLVEHYVHIVGVTGSSPVATIGSGKELPQLASRSAYLNSIRAARAVALASLPALASCVGEVSRSGVLSFLEAVQRPFDLHDQTWLGIPASLPAHLLVSAALAGVLARLWRPKAAGILLGILILTKEAVDLMIIALYQPVTWAYASDSVVDVLASVAGVLLGLWVGTRARGGVVEND